MVPKFACLLANVAQLPPDRKLDAIDMPEVLDHFRPEIWAARLMLCIKRANLWRGEPRAAADTP
jgi:hypothetical protein